MAIHTIYDFMKTQNRPYSVNDIVKNLHSEYSKAVVQQSMDQLVADGKLFEKIYEKEKIYCIIQHSKYDVDELIRIEKELQTYANEVENKYQENMKEIKNSKVLLFSLKSTSIQEDLVKENIKLQKSIRQLTHKLGSLMEKIDLEDLEESKRKAQAELGDTFREYLDRKRLCTEVIEGILVNYPGGENELCKEITGLNTNEQIE